MQTPSQASGSIKVKLQVGELGLGRWKFRSKDLLVVSYSNRETYVRTWCEFQNLIVELY